MTTRPTPVDDAEKALLHAKKYLTTMQDGLGISQEGANIMAKALLSLHKRYKQLTKRLSALDDVALAADGLLNYGTDHRSWSHGLALRDALARLKEMEK